MLLIGNNLCVTCYTYSILIINSLKKVEFFAPFFWIFAHFFTKFGEEMGLPVGAI